jgi:hypothetical protein
MRRYYRRYLTGYKEFNAPFHPSAVANFPLLPFAGILRASAAIGTDFSVRTVSARVTLPHVFITLAISGKLFSASIDVTFHGELNQLVQSVFRKFSRYVLARRRYMFISLDIPVA